jgi:Hemimethylated DNA-binding protein YccV like
VVFDIDPEFSNTNEWYEAIPADARPRKDQPFYHLFAENDCLGVGDTPEEAVEVACLDALKAVDRAPPAPSASTS